MLSIEAVTAYTLQQPGPQGGSLGSQLLLMGSDWPSERGFAGTLNSRSRRLLWHSGHSTASPLKTRVSNVWSHFWQVNS